MVRAVLNQNNTNKSNDGKINTEAKQHTKQTMVRTTSNQNNTTNPNDGKSNIETKQHKNKLW